MITEKDTIKCEAVFNDTKTHRLLWKRVWDKDKPLACVITIHPSISDNIVMDTTTFLTVNGIANLEEFGGVILVNLFSLLTSKLQMRWARDIDINDPENNNYIKKAADDAAIVILAWGRGVAQNARISNRADQVVELLAPHKCVGIGIITNYRHNLLTGHHIPDKPETVKRIYPQNRIKAAKASKLVSNRNRLRKIYVVIRFGKNNKISVSFLCISRIKGEKCASALRSRNSGYTLPNSSVSVVFDQFVFVTF